MRDNLKAEAVAQPSTNGLRIVAGSGDCREVNVLHRIAQAIPSGVGSIEQPISAVLSPLGGNARNATTRSCNCTTGRPRADADDSAGGVRRPAFSRAGQARCPCSRDSRRRSGPAASRRDIAFRRSSCLDDRGSPAPGDSTTPCAFCCKRPTSARDWPWRRRSARCMSCPPGSPKVFTRSTPSASMAMPAALMSLPFALAGYWCCCCCCCCWSAPRLDEAANQQNSRRRQHNGPEAKSSTTHG